MSEVIPCPFANTEQCPIYELEGECYEDKHHLYWPSSEYTTSLEKRFRRLGENVVTICRYLHNTEHALTDKPEKPSVPVMREAVAREKLSRKKA